MMIILVAILGLFGGLVVNYLSDVLPSQRRLSTPICVYCFKSQPWPNYLIWPRHCPDCDRRRPWRVWVVELFFMAASVILWLQPPARLGFAIGWILLLYFSVVVVIDLEHRLILHVVSLTGAVLGLGIGVWLHGWLPTLIGGAVGFFVMLALYYLGDLFARWLARRRGQELDEVALGFGDVNLAGVLGLLLGWPGISAGLILAILLGGFFSLIYLVIMLVRRRYKAFMAIPYGPFLVAAAVFLLYF
jgi:prepilin signal peptidase PulO-like enzyme (type II secretory pathway)